MYTIILQKNEYFDESKPQFEIFVEDRLGSERSFGGFTGRLDFAIEMAIHFAKKFHTEKIVPVGFNKTLWLD